LNTGNKGLGQSMGSKPGRVASLFAVVLAVVLLGGCVSRGGKIPYDPADFTAPSVSDAAVTAYNMPLGPLDVIRVTVFRVPDLSGEYQVDAKGMVALPLIGEVSVREQDPAQFAQTIEGLYRQKYLNDPDISVRVLTTNQYNVTVEGGVNSPGVFPLPGRTTLLGAIALSRGLIADKSNPKRVAIFRKIDGKMKAAAFDLIAIRRGEMTNPEVYPGDIVVVESSNASTVFQEVLAELPLIAVFNNL